MTSKKRKNFFLLPKTFHTQPEKQLYTIIRLTRLPDKLVFEKMLSLRNQSADWLWQSPG